MQPINLPRDFGNFESQKIENIPSKIDFTEAFELCLSEKKGSKPTPAELMEWLKKNNLELDIKNYLQTMYKKGAQNENY